MIVEKRTGDGYTLLAVEGVIKLGESAEFFVETLERTLESDLGDVLIDLSKINYMDSTGIGDLVAYLARFKNRKRSLVLINPSEPIREVLRISNLNQLLPAYATLEIALAASERAT